MPEGEPLPDSTEPLAITRVLVVGAGTMGRGIAQVVAEAGIETILCDADPEILETGLSAIRSRWDQLREKGRRTAEEIERSTARLHAGTLAEAATVGLAIEAIVEKLPAKTALLAEIATISPPATIFATNTSSLSVSALARASGRPDRFIGLHFFNPVPVLPLVEVVRGLETSPETVSASVAFANAIGKTPVVVDDAPGFVANRLLLPMINEAVFALQEGVASKEAIDEIMTLGLSHPMGPLALADLIGLDICLDILETLHRDFGDDKYRPAHLLRRMVASGRLGRKSGQGFYAY
jgi:3-hydroxybutyryl-CoA dehydrogenase